MAKVEDLKKELDKLRNGIHFKNITLIVKRKKIKLEELFILGSTKN